MSMASSSSTPVLRFEQQSSEHILVEALLRTCQRCKKLRKKCDSLLPACRLCQKAKAECTILDRNLDQPLPRRYVSLLLSRIDQLRALKNATNSLTRRRSPSSSSSHSDRGIRVSLPPPNPFAPSLSGKTFDLLFHTTSNGSHSTKFFGSSSCLSLAVQVLSLARRRKILVEDNRPPLGERRLGFYPSPQHHVVQSKDVRALVDIFFSSVAIVYPIIDETTAQADLATYLALNEAGIRPSTAEIHQFFRINMLCAIACAVQSRFHSGYAAEGMLYYTDALTCVEQVTSEVSAATLRALLLLSFHSLIYPQEGDIWKLLEFACRLSLELGYNTERIARVEDEHQQWGRRSTFWALYTMERIVGQCFGRCSDLPENIITTEYPKSPLLGAPVGGSMSDVSLAVHHTQIAYFRSGVYRELYLPAVMRDMDFEWYRERYIQLSHWNPENLVTLDKYGVAFNSCLLSYHASICFVFQPLLLHTISKAQDYIISSMSNQHGDGTDSVPPPMTEPLAMIPRELYESACELIRTYMKVFHAVPGDPLSLYPVTIISAYSIYTSGMICMAFCLLELDGSICVMNTPLSPHPKSPVVGENSGPAASPPRLAENLYSNLCESTASCLVLLTWFSERIPSMVGMLNTYKMLYEKLIPAIVRKGLA